MRPLELVRPFLGLLPDIEPPQRRVPFREKVLYTGVCLFVFLVASQLPLYGIKSNAGADPFYWARVIMASNRYVASSFFFSFLVRGIEVDPFLGRGVGGVPRRGEALPHILARNKDGGEEDDSAISFFSIDEKAMLSFFTPRAPPLHHLFSPPTTNSRRLNSIRSRRWWR